jgi:hypothetical protein
MSYILKKVGRVPNIPCKTFECDDESDLKTIDVSTAPMGSRCYVINTGRTFALNSQKVWKLVPTSSGGGSDDPDTPTPDKEIIYDGGEEV